jgi:riboflavin kinase/FMN adenylyltransferase
LTFSPHPLEVLGRTPPPVITTLARKKVLIEAIAPELRVVVERFDLEFAAQSPEEFARGLLHEKLDARAVVVGENFRFGKGRAGSFDTLRELGRAYGFDVWAEPLSGDDRGVWSSTRVRTSIAVGDLDDANAVLGRPYELEGVVVEGQRRGRTIGFPTANLASIEEGVPAFGVYAVRVRRIDAAGTEGTPLADGVANIGQRPTLAAGFAAEAHLFDFTGDLYGARLRLELVSRLREERRFSGLAELTAQIAIDAQRAREILSIAS